MHGPIRAALVSFVVGAIALLVLSAVVAGQAVASVLIDQLGWVGFREHHVSPGRVAGMALVLAGVALVRFF